MAPESVAFVLLPRFNMVALTTTIEPLRVANYVAESPVYEWTYLGADEDTVVASNGMPLQAGPLDGTAYDLIFVCGSWNADHYRNDRLFAWLRRMERRGAVLGAMDSGAYVLARAGLLGGHTVTVHWHCTRAFAEEFPDVTVREQLFVADRGRMTSGGGTAGLDMMLAHIDARHGRQFALEVAEQILHHPVRPGENPQRRTLGSSHDALHPLVQEALKVMEENIEEQVPIPEIAARLQVSQRKLERLFKRYMGCSTIAVYQIVRLQQARVLLTNTRLSVREVSVACGYSSLSYFSRSFAAHFGRKPREYREAWPSIDPAPAWPGTVFALAGARAR